MFKSLVISLVTRTEMKEGRGDGLYIKDLIECKVRHNPNKMMKVSNICGSSVKETIVIKAIW